MRDLRQPTNTGSSRASIASRRALGALILLWPATVLASPPASQGMGGGTNLQALGRLFESTHTSDANAGRTLLRVPDARLSSGHAYVFSPSGAVFGTGTTAAAGAVGVSGDVDRVVAIETARGRRVYLVAPGGRDLGLPAAPRGRGVPDARNTVELLDPDTPDLRVAIRAPKGSRLDIDQIVATSTHTGIYATLIDPRDTTNANTAVYGQDGQIVLRTTDNRAPPTGNAASTGGASTNGGGGDSDTVQLGGNPEPISGNPIPMAPAAQQTVPVSFNQPPTITDNGLIAQLNTLSAALSVVSDTQKAKHHAASSCK